VAVLVALAAATGGCRGREVVSITLSDPRALPRAWSTARLSVKATYSDTSTGDVTGEASWRTSDPTVARVDPDGTLHGLRRGTAAITATVDGLAATASVEVAAVREVGASPLPLCEGVRLGAMAVDGAGRVTVVGANALRFLAAAPRPRALLSPPWYPSVRELTAVRGSASSPPEWDPVVVATTPAVAESAAPGDVALVMNGTGQAAFVFPTDAGTGALAFLDADGWRWLRSVPARDTAVAIDDDGVVFAAHPSPDAVGSAARVLQVERLAAGGPVDAIELPPPAAGRAVLSSAGRRTMLLVPGAGSRVFEAGAWSAVASLPDALAAPSLHLREDGTADLVDRRAQAITHRRFDGVAWGDPVTVATSAQTSAVAFGPRGALLVAYTRPPAPPDRRQHLLVRRFGGTAWEEPLEIARESWSPAIAPIVVASGTGRYAVLWWSGDLRLWASAFDGTPPTNQLLIGREDPFPVAAAFRPGGDLLVLRGSTPSSPGCGAVSYVLDP